jgi:tyrosine-specific transport protein
MIGFPVVNALAGFIPSTLAMILCYGFATGTGLLLLEATLWFDRRVNLISIVDFALGKGGRWITWVFFLFLFYCLFIAYIDGGGQLFANLLSTLFHHPVPREVGILVCVGLVGMIVYAGTKMVSWMGRLLLLGLGASYCTLISLGLPTVQGNQLLHMNWTASLYTIPILLVCFGYQNIIPTLAYYVNKKINTLRFAIFVGNLIPFFIYFLWNFMILGILPKTDSAALASIVNQSDMVTGLLEKASQSQSILFWANTFSFFAILTPFITNALAFSDFLKDGLKMSSTSKYESFVYGLILIPPTLLTVFYPRLFLRALGLAGGLADVILFGILPATVVWVGRYVKQVKGPYQVAGGKVFLTMVLLFSVGFLFLRR